MQNNKLYINFWMLNKMLQRKFQVAFSSSVNNQLTTLSQHSKVNVFIIAELYGDSRSTQNFNRIISTQFISGNAKTF